MSGAALQAFTCPRAPAAQRLNAYIGTPFVWRGRHPARGWDCWGLVEHVLAHDFGWTIPSFAAVSEALYTDADADAGGSRADRFAVQSNIITEGRSQWRRVPLEPGALALFSIGGLPVHVGVVATPSDFLHVRKGALTVLERFASPEWSRRLEGCYVPD